MSFDKGFHSPDNQKALAKLLDRAVLPKRGKLSATEQTRESDPEFIEQRRRHSAIESAINALEVQGLDRCLDHGITGFKRSVALAVVARNLQCLGALLCHQELQSERIKRQRELRSAA